jgi:hypothetical protein
MEIALNNVSNYIDSKVYEDTLTNSLGVLTGILLNKLCPADINLLGIIKKSVNNKK